MDCRFYLNGKRIKRITCLNAGEFAVFKSISIDGTKYIMTSIEVKYNAGLVTFIQLRKDENPNRQDIYDFEFKRL